MRLEKLMTKKGSKKKRPSIGIGVFVVNEENKFIVGKRKGRHNPGVYGLPGGHLEFNESFEDCCRREVFEEVGVDITDIRFLTATNNFYPEEKLHYVTLFFLARLESGVPKNLEPDKCMGWKWIKYGSILNGRIKPVFCGLKEVIGNNKSVFVVNDMFGKW